jgi:hypothetical protein
MNKPHLRQLSSFEADHDRKRAGRIAQGHSTLPANAADSAGHAVSDSGCFGMVSDSGCFGIRIGGGGIQTPQKLADDKEEDPTALIAKTMNHLSLMERDQAYEDMHGVSAAVQETPELISKALNVMEQSLQTIRHKPAYDMALSIKKGYVQDPQFRLMFLRAARFDSPTAARQLVEFLEWKLKLFGTEKVCQAHIGLQDLDADARFMVESGYYQILPARDSRGRMILTIAGNYHVRLHRTLKSTLQTTFYTIMCATEEETNQKNGIVLICYGLGPKESDMKSEKFNTIREIASIAHSLPLRWEATHYLAQPNHIQYPLKLLTKSISHLRRARLRVHFGTHLECLYTLLSFGLPIQFLPFTTEHELKTGIHKKWVERRIIKEEEMQRHGVFSGIDLPDRNDVLIGKGKPFQNHPGNQRLLELVQGHLDEYNQADRIGGRKAVACKVVQEVLHPSCPQGDGAKFLKRREDTFNSGWWEVVTEEDVLIEKVCNAFRATRKARKSVR